MATATSARSRRKLAQRQSLRLRPARMARGRYRERSGSTGHGHGVRNSAIVGAGLGGALGYAAASFTLFGPPAPASALLTGTAVGAGVGGAWLGGTAYLARDRKVSPWRLTGAGTGVGAGLGAISASREQAHCDPAAAVSCAYDWKQPVFDAAVFGGVTGLTAYLNSPHR